MFERAARRRGRQLLKDRRDLLELSSEPGQLGDRPLAIAVGVVHEYRIIRAPHVASDCVPKETEVAVVADVARGKFLRATVVDRPRAEDAQVESHSVVVDGFTSPTERNDRAQEKSGRRTESAMPTMTSRDPSNASRPCAMRMLSTSSTSPASHGARTVLASYV